MNILKDVKSNVYMLKIIAKVCPARIATAIIQAIFTALESVFAVIFFRFVLNAFEQNTESVQMFIFIAVVISLFCVTNFYSSWYNQKYRPKTDQIIAHEVSKTVINKASSVDLSSYESPEFYNNYTNGASQINWRVSAALENLTLLLSTTISAGYLIYVAISLDVWSILFLAIPIMSLFSYRYLNKLSFKRYWEEVLPNRKREYVGRTVLLRQFAKEIRLSNIFSVLKRIYSDADKQSEDIIDKYKAKEFALRCIDGFFNYPLVWAGIWIYVIYRAMITGSLSVGNLFVVALAITGAAGMTLSMINNFSQITENSPYVEKFKDFMNYDSKICENQKGLSPVKPIITLEFKDVGFRYAGRKSFTLRNVSFKIKLNEKIALVGRNGAGKSTLIKLIMRLYDPTEGEILLNGINIREYNVKEYRELFGTVFQDYQIFAMSALENVIMDEFNDEFRRENAIDALKSADIYDKVSNLINGVNTTLTKEFDDEGAILSGGEFQKIATSRIFAKDASVLILDEPSSALDPIAEDKMYQTLMKSYSNEDFKIVIYISHRLSAAKLSDKILVLDNGILTEQGTHDDLIKLDGKYAEMFKRQADTYLKEALI